jgi:4-methylaminobutanoate oxidase (formaldehyde-forming)
MVGLFEPDAAAWSVDSIPHDFSFGEIEPDFERVGPFVTTAMSRVPKSLDVGIRNFFCGPESFTPDLSPVVGEAAAIRNYFVAAGAYTSLCLAPLPNVGPQFQSTALTMLHHVWRGLQV